MRPKKIWGMQAHITQGNFKHVFARALKYAKLDGCTYEIWCNHGSKHIRTIVVSSDGYAVEWNVHKNNVFKQKRLNKHHKR